MIIPFNQTADQPLTQWTKVLGNRGLKYYFAIIQRFLHNPRIILILQVNPNSSAFIYVPNLHRLATDVLKHTSGVPH